MGHPHGIDHPQGLIWAPTRVEDKGSVQPRDNGDPDDGAIHDVREEISTKESKEQEKLWQNTGESRLVFDVFVQYSFLLIQGRRNEGTTWNTDEHGSRWPATWSPSCWSCPRPKHRPARALGNLGTCWGKKRRKGTVRYNMHQYTSLLPLKHCYFGVNIFGQSLWHLNWCVDGPTGLQGPIPLSNTMQNANCCWVEWHLKISRDYRPGHHLREFSLGVAKFNFTVFREKKWCLTHPRYWNMYRFVWKWGKYLKSYGLLWWFPLGHHLPTNCKKDHGKES